MTRLEAVLGDITTTRVDAIVNAANRSLMGGSGVDGAIHRAGGPAILAECREIVARSGNLATGHAVATTAGGLPARHVIHTVGPIWNGASPEAQDRDLASCYTSSLDVAAELGDRTIAFPNISTGVYRFPLDRAASVAVGAVRTWVADHPGSVDEVRFVCFNRDNLLLVADALAATTA